MFGAGGSGSCAGDSEVGLAPAAFDGFFFPGDIDGAISFLEAEFWEGVDGRRIFNVACFGIETCY